MILNLYQLVLSNSTVILGIPRVARRFLAFELGIPRNSYRSFLGIRNSYVVLFSPLILTESQRHSQPRLY